MAVNALVVGEIVYLFNSRYLHQSVLSREGLLGSRPVLVTILSCWCCNWPSPTGRPCNS